MVPSVGVGLKKKIFFKLCGPAVYFVLTNDDFQQREWIIRCSVADLESVV
jgi:hypothetical protein